MKPYVCEDCGATVNIGDWPICDDGTGKHGHARPAGMHTFSPYWDENLAENPVWVTSWADRKRLMRQANLDYRDKMSKGDQTARADRANEHQKEIARM